jgi:hypothetical protein
MLGRNQGTRVCHFSSASLSVYVKAANGVTITEDPKALEQASHAVS